MKRSEIRGICSYCGTEISKNSRAILNHFSKCEDYTVTGNHDRQLILMIEGAREPDYWMVIKAKSDIPLHKIDRFLRDIWVECCDHLSKFTDDNSSIDMSQKIEQIFVKGRNIDYVYDFGTSTEITLSLLGELDEDNEKDIQIMIRNKEIDYECSYCHNSAIAICPFCIYKDGGLLCKSCLKNHECVEDEGEDITLPLVNSPRAGECGYDGYEDHVVKKYFPKDIF